MSTKQLSMLCPECGSPLSVDEELMASMIVADGVVEVPVTHPTCENGHQTHGRDSTY